MIRLLTLALCLLSTACVSGGHAIDSGEPARLELSSYARDGMVQFVLVNEAHTSRVELYSEKSQSANTKVASNEDLQELVDYLDDNGFFTNAVAGQAPEATGGKALELELNGATVQWYVSHLSTRAQQEAFTRCYQAMLQVYNSIFAAQSVENTQGESIFGKKRRSR